MGNNCCIKQTGNNSNIYSTKALMNMQNFNGMDFYFSTQNISRLEGQCLVVFSDRKLKLKKTNLAKIVTEKQNRKIKEYVYAYLEDKKVQQSLLHDRNELQDHLQMKNNNSDTSTKQSKDNEFLLIDFDIPTIKFSKLLVVFVEPWQGKTSIKRLIEDRLIKALTQVQKIGIKQIALIQFDEQLGIPTNVGAAIMARSVFCLSSNFKIATLCCQTISQQLSYISFFQNFKQEVTLSSYTRKSIKESNYY